MPTLLNTGTKDIPLDFARQLSKLVNQEWDSGSFLSKVTPVTQDLLRFWFNDTFCSTRYINFHKGQKQAILNAIYCHEILKADSILSMYQQASQDLLTPNFFNYIANDKFQHPKYCIKMATGTGKTFLSWCIAKELLDRGIFLINDRVAKPSSEVNEGDILTLQLGRHKLTVKVLKTVNYAKKEDSSKLYEVLKDELIEESNETI